MQPELNDPHKRIHPVSQFLPTELEDFNLEWDNHWLSREEKVRGTTAQRPLDMICLYWKYAWNTARCPYLIPSFVEANNRKITREACWTEMIKISENQLAVIGTQVMAFTGFYFAYENFVTNCIEAKEEKKFPDLNGYEKIRDKLREVFDCQIELKIWSHPSVERIRRVRNDLAHNGGVPSPLTLKQAADMIIAGHIAITPNDIKEEMEDLLIAIDVVVDIPFPSL